MRTFARIVVGAACLALWPALTIALCLVLLQPVKGAVVGLQYGLRMHGFDAVRRIRRGIAP